MNFRVKYYWTVKKWREVFKASTREKIAFVPLPGELFLDSSKEMPIWFYTSLYLHLGDLDRRLLFGGAWPDAYLHNQTLCQL